MHSPKLRQGDSSPTLGQLSFFFVLALTTFFIFYPGWMSFDSQSIYADALRHQYQDHHPPLMAYLWHYLDLIWKGPAPMLCVSLGLLWTGIYVLAFKNMQSTVLRYGAMLIPLTPWVAVYEGWIWKDNLFTFGYGLIAMVFAHHTLTKQKFSSLQIVCLGVILFFCSAVKYQAIFILPIILTWFAFIHLTPKILFAGLWGAVLTGGMIGGVKGVNHLLVTQQGKGSTHSWQYVKIYDLAGMSLYTGQVLVPQFLWRYADVSIEDVRKKHDLLWEPLVVEPDSPFRETRTQEERQQLLQRWQHEVMRHPLAYLQHRGYLWMRGLMMSAPGKGWLVETLAPKEGDLPQPDKASLSLRILFYAATLSAFLFLLPFQIAFFPLALRARRFPESLRQARVLLFLSMMGSALPAVLFVFSLAFVPRYIYFTFYFFMLSVPFALHCLAALARHKKYQGWGSSFLENQVLSHGSQALRIEE